MSAYQTTVENVTNSTWSIYHARLRDFLRDSSVLSKITQPFMIITIWYSKIYLIAISAAISAEICDAAKKNRENQKQCYNFIVALLLSAAKEL